MQNDPNNRPYYYAPPRVAGRLISQKSSHAGLWASFSRQSRGMQISIITIAALLVVVALLVPYAVFSGLFGSSQGGQAVVDANQSNAVTTPAVATDIPTAVATDTPVATTVPVAAPTLSALDKGVNSNPWGYDFNAGSFITAPPATFCNYFACINGFWNGQGYVEECLDGTYTLAGGVPGDCDAHGGDLRPLYYHPALSAPQPTQPPPPALTPTPAAKSTPTPTLKPTPTSKVKIIPTIVVTAVATSKSK